MGELSLQLRNEIELIEILLIIGVSFIGACVHEYIFRSSSTTYRNFFKNSNIWISTLISSILCFIIDPWITAFNPRLILLPPLIFGLAGMDLVMRLVTLKGSTSIIEYILGFLGVHNSKEDNNYGVPDANPSTSPQEETTNEVLDNSQFEQLERLVDNNFDAINNLIVRYYIHHDRTIFIHEYSHIKHNLQLLQRALISYQIIPIFITIKISEILKKEIEIDTIYHDLISQQES